MAWSQGKKCYGAQPAVAGISLDECVKRPDGMRQQGKDGGFAQASGYEVAEHSRACLEPAGAYLREMAVSFASRSSMSTGFGT